MKQESQREQHRKLLTGVSTMPPADGGGGKRWVMMVGTVGHVRSRTWPHSHTHSCRPGTMALILFLPWGPVFAVLPVHIIHICSTVIFLTIQLCYHPSKITKEKLLTLLCSLPRLTLNTSNLVYFFLTLHVHCGFAGKVFLFAQLGYLPISWTLWHYLGSPRLLLILHATQCQIPGQR